MARRRWLRGVHHGLCLSDVVCISAGLSEHSRPLHSFVAFLSDLISFSQRLLGPADNRNSFLGEESEAPEKRGCGCEAGNAERQLASAALGVITLEVSVPRGFLVRMGGAGTKL